MYKLLIQVIFHCYPHHHLLCDLNQTLTMIQLVGQQILLNALGRFFVYSSKNRVIPCVNLMRVICGLILSTSKSFSWYVKPKQHSVAIKTGVPGDLRSSSLSSSKLRLTLKSQNLVLPLLSIKRFSSLIYSCTIL